jgi:20S proteasome alpha/beta subunit
MNSKWGGKPQYNLLHNYCGINIVNSNTLYGKRFFPYYTFNLMGGLDEYGNGVLYGYDAIGSFDKINYGCQGTG